MLLGVGVLVSARKQGGRRRFAKDTMQVPLIAPLFDGAIDIIGDVHGEIGALRALLDRMGYDGNGEHLDGRRLVFVGDLVDRGPDSPSVLRLVRRLVERGTAQCILGNHELSLMRGSKKRGNRWFWGETETIRNDKGGVWPQALFTSATERLATLTFLGNLPLALEREDVAVVHASWQPASIERLRASRAKGAAAAMAEFEEEVAVTIRRRGLDRTDRRDRDKIGLLQQNRNPVRTATSGPEGYAPRRFFASGRWRTLERIKWWDSEPPPPGRLVVVGHFWRRFMGDIRAGQQNYTPSGPDMFAGYRPEELLGPGKGVMCIDFAVGVRWAERGKGLPEGALGTHLGALRLPERVLHLADGRVLKVS